LTYAGNLESLRTVNSNARYRFAQTDICDEASLKNLFADVSPGAVLHLAAESHVDRSITGSRSFIDTNIVGRLLSARSSLTLTLTTSLAMAAIRKQTETVRLQQVSNLKSLAFTELICHLDAIRFESV
jgi:dTDP-D-glucose 4,6-dehydratase